MKEEKIDIDLMLRTALDVGENLFLNGADIRRVEDALTRICRTYGVEHVEVFCVATMLQASVRMPDGTYLQEMRDLKGACNNLARLEELNNISRRICNKELSLEEAEAEIQKVKKLEPYRTVFYYVATALGAAAFCIFFGGTWRDCSSALIAGLPITLFDRHALKEANPMARVILEAAIAGIFVSLTMIIGLGQNVDLISIGVLMLLTPGMVFGNAIQDFFNNDMLAGFSKFVQAIMISIMITIGISIAYIVVIKYYTI